MVHYANQAKLLATSIAAMKRGLATSSDHDDSIPDPPATTSKDIIGEVTTTQKIEYMLYNRYLITETT